jgi:Integrase core domain
VATGFEVAQSSVAKYMAAIFGGTDEHRGLGFPTPVPTNPTAEWLARQITEAFPWNEAPRYLIRDRDHAYGVTVIRRLRAMGIRDKPIAPGSPWQNGFAERLIGSIRRECTDHIIAVGEGHLRQVLRSYAHYYNKSRTHHSLNKDAPIHRLTEGVGTIVSRPILGDFRYTQQAGTGPNGVTA